MSTKMVPKRNDDMVQSIHQPNKGKDYERGTDGAFDIDDADVERVKGTHGLVERAQQRK